jgi:hypothetical protein
MKILALHGKQQNGEAFRSRLGHLPNKIQQLQASINATTMMIKDYVDAPFELPLKQGDAIPMRTWYLRRGEDDNNSRNSSIDYEYVEKTLNYLEAIWHSSSSSEGKYIGILVFSQGGMITVMVAYRYPGLQFAIIGGALDTTYSSSSSDDGTTTSQYNSLALMTDVIL